MCVCVCVHSCFQGHYPSFANLLYKRFCTDAGGQRPTSKRWLTKLCLLGGCGQRRLTVYLQFLIYTKLILLVETFK